MSAFGFSFNPSSQSSGKTMSNGTPSPFEFPLLNQTRGGGFFPQSQSSFSTLFGESTAPISGVCAPSQFQICRSTNCWIRKEDDGLRTSQFGPLSTSTFGPSDTSSPFGVKSTSASDNARFSFSSPQVIGQTAATFDSNLNGSTYPFGTSGFGMKSTTPSSNAGFSFSAPPIFSQTRSAFSNSNLHGSTHLFGTQKVPSAGGSRVTDYAATRGGDGNDAKVESLYAMNSYMNKSHEELRLEDYQSGDKGGPRHASQFLYPNPSSSSAAPSNPSLFASPPAYSNRCAIGFVPPEHIFPSPFAPNKAFINTTAPESLFHRVGGLCMPPQRPAPSFHFNDPIAPHSMSSSILSPINPFSFSTSCTTCTLSHPHHICSTPPPEISSKCISCLTNINAQSSQPITTPFFSQQDRSTSLPIGQKTQNPWVNLSSNTENGPSSANIVKEAVGQSFDGQGPTTGCTETMQQLPVTNPFGTSDVITISVDCPGSTVSIQYGISSRPISDCIPVERNSLLRIQLPAQKYNAKSDSSKVAFVVGEEKKVDNVKEDASFLPGENPRSWILSPSKERISRADSEKSPETMSTVINLHENGNISLQQFSTIPSSSQHQYTDGISGETPNSREEEYLNVKVFGNEDDKAYDLHRHGSGIELVLPKLRNADYYTKPSIQELAAKEKAEPGFCRHVKDFVIGRHGCGSIKFMGETDIRKLDIDAHVQFDNREVVVYMDKSRRPPVGQGLNKPAEITLLNVKCISKKTGEQYIDGPKVDQFREMLIKKATEHQAEFVSYDPVVGEWKFRVLHFQ